MPTTTASAQLAAPRPARRAGRFTRPLGTAALVAGVVLAEAAVAAALVVPRLLPLVGLVALAAAVAFAARFPVAAIGGVLVLVCSFLPQAIVTVGVGPLSVRPYEVALATLMAATVLAPRARTWGGFAGVALAAFLAVVGASALLAVSEGRTSVSDAFQWGRGFGVLLVFYAVVRLVPERRDVERLLKVGAAIAAATGFVALAIRGGLDATTLLGPEVDLYLKEDAGAGLGAGTDRIRLPGVALAFALVWWAVLRLTRASGGARVGWAVAVLGIALNLALSFNRNMWAASLLGLALILLLGGGALRRPLVAGLVALTAVAAILVLAGPGIRQTSPLQPFVERGRTLLDPRQIQRESSLEDRRTETGRAWEAVVANPILGVGVGSGFGLFSFERRGSSAVVSPQRFLHNQYLYLLLVGGIPALAAFLAFLVSTLRRAARGREDTDVLVWGTGIVMVMISAVVMISFADSNMAVALALLAGACWAATQRAAALPAAA